jgi:KaiC/GvpD/RAD55 family RecA-like ATPase
VEKFVLVDDDCLTVTGTPGIGKSIFYAYFFEEFRKAHRDERVIVAISFENNSIIKEVPSSNLVSRQCATSALITRSC